MNVFLKRIHQDDGVAMISVIVLSVILMMLGGGMYLVAMRENRMTQADYVGGQAFYYAEGGIENAIDILNYAGTEAQLTSPRTDQSSDGVGYLMDPVPANRQNPVACPQPTAGSCDPVEMHIGRETYKVWIDTVTASGTHCENCGLFQVDPAYLMITAEGQSVEGYRKLQQKVRVEASGYPISLFVNGDAYMNGTPDVVGQSLYVNGNFCGRRKLTIQPGTEDLIYGGPAGVRATGYIFNRENCGNSYIYTEDGLPNGGYYKDPEYANDRDSRGPAGNTFTATDLNSLFDTAGMTTDQLTTLKGMAQSSGYYLNPTTGDLMIRQTDLPNRDGNIVIYVEYKNGAPESNVVDLNFTWPFDYPTGQAVIVVKNGSVKMNGNEVGNLQGFIYCPDGQLLFSGGGQGSFTGAVWAKGIEEQAGTGNFVFNMTEQFLDDAPFFSWRVVREADWKECEGENGC